MLKLRNLIYISGGITWNNIEDIYLNSQMEKIFLTEIQKHGSECLLEKFEIPQGYQANHFF